MSKIKNGFAAAITGFFLDYIIVTMNHAFLTTGLMPGGYLALLSLIPVVSTLASMIDMLQWSILFTFGWLFGAIVLLTSGLLSITDIIYFVVLPIVFLIIRAFVWYKQNFGDSSSYGWAV